MTATGPLQKLFVSPHCYGERVHHFIAIFFRIIQNN